jgi:HEAT repeat protein
VPDFEKLILNRDWKRLVQFLDSRRVEVRVRAIQGLGQARAWRAIPLLAERLKDPEGPVRLASVEALAAIRRREGAQALIAALPNGHKDVSDAAWRALVAMGGAEQTALAESIPDLRRHVPLLLQVLDHLDPGAIIPALVELLDDPDDRVVERAKARLGALKSAADEALEAAFLGGTAQQAQAVADIWKPRAKDRFDAAAALLPRVAGDPDRQMALLYLLADTGDERAAPILKDLLRDPSRQVRITALALLSRFRTQAIEAFKNLLREPDFPDRSRLIAYVKQRWRMWGDALVDLLSTKDYSDWRVRELAKTAMGGRADLLPNVVQRHAERGDVDVADVVDLLLFDPNAAVGNLVAQLEPLAESTTEAGRRHAALLREAVRRLGAQAVPALADAARSPDCRAPGLAVRLLEVAGPAAAETVVALLGYRAPGREGLGAQVRGAARDVAVALGAPCGPLVVRALQLPGATKETEEALEGLGDHVLAPVVQVLTDGYANERDWKLWCRLLSGLKGDEARPLLPLLNHPSNEVRRAAFRALRGRGGREVEDAMARLVNANISRRPVEPRVLWALDVLEQLTTDSARRTVQKLVTHPDPRVKRRALDYVRRTAQARARRPRTTAPKLPPQPPPEGADV